LNPQNSSLPPNTQHPHARPQPRKRKSKKKRGGQPGRQKHQRHRLRCPHCGETTCADLPAAVPRGQSGPRLIAFAALLMAYFRQSKRRTTLFPGALVNQPLAFGCNIHLRNKLHSLLKADR